MLDAFTVQRLVETSIPALAVSAVALLIGWTAWAEAGRGAGTKRRRMTKGLILSSRVAVDVAGARPAVTYAYEIGDDIYEGFTVNFGAEAFATPKQAQAIVDQYPQGAIVPVWYDPDDPADSVLTRKRRLWPLWGLTGAAAMWAGALWFDVWRSL